MKFYIASSLGNAQTVKRISKELTAKGFQHTFDWTSVENVDSAESLRALGEKEVAGVLAADFVIVLTPAGKGSHIEFGIALAAGKRIYLYSATADLYEPDKTSTFYHLAEVNRIIGTVEEIVPYISSRERQDE